MNIQPITLQGHHIRLEPLAHAHAADLAAAADSTTFRYHFRVPELTEAGFMHYIDMLNGLDGMLAFAQVLNATGRAVGSTTYMYIQPQHRNLEIGSTWIGAAHQGTMVNPEAKYLLLCHAFDAQGAIRVQLKTDSRNLQSQRAIEKLGAVKEGVLRNHIVMPDGYLRHTVMYSITMDEWPAVRARLEARLGLSEA